MSKPPEEGEIWEWRAFGQPSDFALKTVHARPIRNGVKDNPGEDRYLISPISDQNVKLRLWRAEWVLKLKLLLATKPRRIELYTETAGWVYRFPVGFDLVSHAAKLLGIGLPDSCSLKGTFSSDELISALENATPPATQVRVVKRRSQFDFGEGWVELAEAQFPAHRTHSLSIHSLNSEVVETILDQLQLGTQMEVMNYVEACRRWAG